MYKLKICFITQTSQRKEPIKDGSVRYRCFHPSIELKKYNIFSVITSAYDFFANPSYQFDLYIFHRPNFHIFKECEEIFNNLEKMKKVLIADYDDLIIGDYAIAIQTSLAERPNHTISILEKIFYENTYALKKFSMIFCSTNYLAKQINKIHPGAKYEVVPNFIPTKLINFFDKHKYWKFDRSVNLIGYFPGTATHISDFEKIGGLLLEILSNNDLVRLSVTGEIELNSKISELKNVTINGPVPYMELFDRMKSVNICLAPLQQNEFCKSKSRVKFLEAAISGCYLISSPTPDFLEIEDAEIGLAHNIDEWRKMIEQNLFKKINVERQKHNFLSLKKNIPIQKYLESF